MSENNNLARLTRTACVYTALIGRYEKLNEQPVAATSSLPFICFTDDPDLKSDTWQIRRVEPLFGMDPIRSQRTIKLRPHEHLPDFDCSIYIDNSVVLKASPKALIEQYLGAKAFCLPEHSYRDSVLEEFLEVEARACDDPGRIFEQLNHYSLELPDVLEEKPFWTAILLRDHRNTQVREMLDIWVAQIQRYSRRDQLSVNYAFKRAGLTPGVLRIDNWESWFHSWPIGTESRAKTISGVANQFLSHPAARARVLARDNAAKSARVAELEAMLAEERHRRHALEETTTELAQAVADQKFQNQALLSSTSWRITAPLRNVVGAARSFRRSAIQRLQPTGQSAVQVVPTEPVEPAQNVSFPALPEDPLADAFFREGFIGPLNLFTPAQCELILKHFRRGVPPPPNPEWFKDLAARDRFFYELAKRPVLIALLRPLLGEDFFVWGAAVIERTPGQTHVWHTDLETSAPTGRFVSVWVGLEDTCRGSALQFISRSHRFGRPIQQEVHERGLRRGEATDQLVTAWAREHDARSDFVQPDMSDGQALIFDGRLWHASHNTGDRPRAALLLQYAATGTPVVIPAFNHAEWPFRFTSARPPSVMVAGKIRDSDMVPPPVACSADSTPLCSQAHSGSGFYESRDGWIPYHFFQGPTALLTEMESHASVLSPGHSPHPPHCHVQEEILIVLSGEAEILHAEGPEPEGANVERLGPGSFVYYPAYQYHTIRNTSGSPVTYLMFKWQAGPAEVSNPMQTEIFDIGGVSAPAASQPMSMPVLFEAPTGYLDKLHAHVTDLQVGASYPDHIDEHEVAVIVFAGTVETLGKTVGPGGIVFYAAGEPHGMRNVGNEPARYLVFEFHRSRLVEASV